MKYLRLHPILENSNWLLSKKDDIIECSYDLTDLSYNFHHCGRIKQGEDLSSYLNEFRGYHINYDGSLGVVDSENYRGYVSGIWDGDFIFDKNKDDKNPGYKEIFDSILPNLEDVIIKLRATVFNEGDFLTNFHIYCYDLGDPGIIMINVKLMFKAIL